MNEWVSSCGQGSLECHRLPPHTKNEKKYNKALSPPPPTLIHILPSAPLLNRKAADLARSAATRVHRHMTKREITADEAANM